MTGDLKMPERLPDDGRVAVERVDDDHLVISVGEQRVFTSLYNAWRVFGLLSVMLGLPLSKRIGKAIKL